MNRLTSQIIIDIINHEMGMLPNTVWIRDQNFKIPNDMGLYIIVGESGAVPMANVTTMQQKTNNSIVTQHQICQVNQLENIQIDVVSRSNLALTRKIEVLMAMQSFYAQQQQESNNFKIARIPVQFIRTSEADGGSIINRYTLTIACQVWYYKDTIMNPTTEPLGDYYDDFTQRVDDAKTIGTPTPMVEFEINSETEGPFP